MLLITTIAMYVILIWSFVYTISYGMFVWNQKNKLGAIAVILLALMVLILPIITLTIRG